jgi:hypothetical protein
MIRGSRKNEEKSELTGVHRKQRHKYFREIFQIEYRESNSLFWFDLLLQTSEVDAASQTSKTPVKHTERAGGSMQVAPHTR